MSNDSSNGKLQFGVCDVHRLVNKDTRPRNVYYCNICQAWICLECDNDIPKRAYAMMLKKFRKE